ncbi:MAG: LLM class flavin-dependent oxidoreductase [Gemmatimonadota bacterium]|nr:LLM class flavin-dependent oxidoreductase [Gemmatimonadota bacterium]
MSIALALSSTPPLRVSVLDQTPVSEGTTSAVALRNSIDLAKHAEAFGYHRYWVAEHHGSPMIAGPSPEVLIAAIAAATSRMRVGSGGVMLPHYSALKVAENFSVLAGLFPNRIDLGLGRAAGTDPETSFALQRDRRQRSPDDFPQQLAELFGYLDDSLPRDHPFRRLSALLPGVPERPEPWLLGSSHQSAMWAAELGLPYAFADFINPAGAEIAALYRDQFTPSSELAAPRVMVAVSAISADTSEEAERLASSMRMAITLLRAGSSIAIPTPETALEFLGTRPSPSSLPVGRRAVVGDARHVRSGLEAVAREYGAEEVMVVTITHDHAARLHSYDLIANAFELGERASASDATLRATQAA